jgi:hypothetical protein
MHLRAQAKMDILEDRGYFWWHNNTTPNDGIAGTLRVDQDGRISLELDGILSKGQSPFRVIEQTLGPDCKEICGVLKGSGKHALLHGISKRGGRFSSNGISYEKYHATTCLLRPAAFANDCNIDTVTKVTANLSGFEEWIGLDDIRVTQQPDGLAAVYVKPNNLSYTVGPDTLDVTYDLLGPWLAPASQNNVSMRQMAMIEYNFNTEATLTEATRVFGLIADLIIVLTGSEYRLPWPTVTLADGSQACDAYFPRHKGDSEPPQRFEAWVPFHHLEGNLGALFQTWKDKRAALGPAIYLYLGTRRGLTIYVEHRFVNLIWGIESLHRSTTPSEHAKSRVQEKIDRILSFVTNKRDRAWTKQKLKYAGEPSLAERIFAIINSLPVTFEKALVTKFAKDCADLRNKISHFGGHAEEASYSQFIVELERKSDALSFLYHATILRLLGIEGQHIVNFFDHGVESFSVKRALIDSGLVARIDKGTVATPDGK